MPIVSGFRPPRHLNPLNSLPFSFSPSQSEMSRFLYCSIQNQMNKNQQKISKIIKKLPEHSNISEKNSTRNFFPFEMHPQSIQQQRDDL